MEGPLHSILLRGNLKNDNGVISLHLPSSIYRNGLWQMLIKSISYNAKEAINVCVSIETNFVTDLRLSLSNEIEPYNSILNLVILKSNINDEKSYDFDTNCWFTINCYNDVISFILRDIFNTQILKKDINVVMLVLLKQVK